MTLTNAQMAQTLERFRQGVASHDRENPDHPSATGIGVSHFDLERLGFDEGESLWPGVAILVDGKCSGNFRVLCGHVSHGEQKVAEAKQPLVKA